MCTTDDTEDTEPQGLAHELGARGHRVERQRQLPIIYRGVRIDCACRLDLVVNDLLIVEVKTTECLLPIHSAQLPSYLRLSGLPLGLLINFNVHLLRQGVRRLKPFPSVSVSSVSSVVQPSRKGE
jgi:GxxExxY protein